MAFILSLSGFILSVVMPQSDASDAAMVAALFCAAASGITTSVFTKQLVRSRYQNYIALGGLMLLFSFPV